MKPGLVFILSIFSRAATSNNTAGAVSKENDTLVLTHSVYMKRNVCCSFLCFVHLCKLIILFFQLLQPPSLHKNHHWKCL